jgi:hypothetical protein
MGYRLGWSLIAILLISTSQVAIVPGKFFFLKWHELKVANL